MSTNRLADESPEMVLDLSIETVEDLDVETDGDDVKGGVNPGDDSKKFCITW